jgi:hypothetical protein
MRIVFVAHCAHRNGSQTKRNSISKKFWFFLTKKKKKKTNSPRSRLLSPGNLSNTDNPANQQRIAHINICENGLLQIDFFQIRHHLLAKLTFFSPLTFPFCSHQLVCEAHHVTFGNVLLLLHRIQRKRQLHAAVVLLIHATNEGIELEINLNKRLFVLLCRGNCNNWLFHIDQMRLVLGVNLSIQTIRLQRTRIQIVRIHSARVLKHKVKKLTKMKHQKNL